MRSRRLPQRLPPVVRQPLQPDRLRGHLRPQRARRPPLRAAHALPARCLVTGARARPVDARLQQHWAHAVQPLPVVRQPPGRLAQHVRGQIRHLHAPPEQEAVVADNPLDARSARALVPAQVLVARPQPQRRCHAAEHAQCPALRFHQIHQAAARRPARPQRMILLQQPGAPLALLRRPGQAQAHRAERRQRTLELSLRLRGPRRGRPATARPAAPPGAASAPSPA